MTVRVSQSMRKLLVDRIDSLEKVDLVATLHRAPRATMSIQDLSAALRMPRDAVTTLAMQLRGASLVDVVARERVQLLSLSESDAESIAELVRTYQTDPIYVITLLSEIALDRVRAMASRAFAEALAASRKKSGPDE
jgi:hypothetical protein